MGLIYLAKKRALQSNPGRNHATRMGQVQSRDGFKGSMPATLASQWKNEKADSLVVIGVQLY